VTRAQAKKASIKVEKKLKELKESNSGKTLITSKSRINVTRIKR